MITLLSAARRLVAVAFALLVVCQAGSAIAAPARNEIIWDKWGVPHIYATSREKAFYAMGWAQMSAHPNLMARIYGQSKGRAAEHWGAEYEDSDVMVQATRTDERAAVWLDAQDPDYKRYLAAYAKGASDYAARHPGKLEAANRWVFPISARDVLANTQRQTFLEFFLESWNLGAYFQAEKKAAQADRGSNGWAISPSKSADGRAMLVMNPHMPWTGDLIFFESHMVVDGIDAYGVSLVGAPMLSIAFTADHGWTHTVNNNDSMDIYELSLREGGYLYDGAVKPFTARGSRTIKILQPDGTLRSREIPLLESAQGDVVHLNTRTGKALALRFTGSDRSGGIKQYWDMLEARTADSFTTTIQRMQLPYFNTIYADRAGDIFYQYNAAVPDRAVGDYNYWRSILPGDRSDLVWDRYLGVEVLPRVVNPASGFVQNANDPPWLATLPQQMKAADYPRQLPPPFQYLRSQKSLKMLSESGKLTYDQVVADKFSTRMELADRVLPDLLAIARTSGDPLVREAGKVLEAWDRQGLPDSRGAVLFIRWVEAMDGVTGQGQIPLRPSWFAVPWEEANPLTTPRGIRSPDKAVASLRAAAEVVKKDYGALDVPYGQVYRLRRGGVDLPASTAHQSLGAFNAAVFDRKPDGTYEMVGGETFVGVIAFGPELRAEGLLTYGNSSEPSSPHFTDQLPLSSAGKLRPFLLKRPEIEAAAERRERF